MSEDTDFEQIEDEPDQAPAEERDKRSLRGLLVAVAVVVIVILVLLMLRGCGGEDAAVSTQDLKTIEPVARYDVQAGLISIWVEDPERIGNILESAGFGDAEVVDMEDGRFVVVVGQGNEKKAVEALKGRDGVHDVGLVYTKN